MAKNKAEISISTWFFIIASIIIASALLVVGLKFFVGLKEISEKTAARDEFEKIVDSISPLCSRDVGSKNVLLLNINDYILAIYASDKEDEEGYPQSEACLQDINSEECTSTGINLCISVSKEDIYCKKVDCIIEMQNFGVPKSGFKSILNRLTKKGSYDVQLTIERTNEGLLLTPKFLD